MTRMAGMMRTPKATRATSMGEPAVPGRSFPTSDCQFSVERLECNEDGKDDRDEDDRRTGSPLAHF